MKGLGNKMWAYSHVTFSYMETHSYEEKKVFVFCYIVTAALWLWFSVF